MQKENSQKTEIGSCGPGCQGPDACASPAGSANTGTRMVTAGRAARTPSGEAYGSSGRRAVGRGSGGQESLQQIGQRMRAGESTEESTHKDTGSASRDGMVLDVLEAL